MFYSHGLKEGLLIQHNLSYYCGQDYIMHTTSSSLVSILRAHVSCCQLKETAFVMGFPTYFLEVTQVSICGNSTGNQAVPLMEIVLIGLAGVFGTAPSCS